MVEKNINLKKFFFCFQTYLYCTLIIFLSGLMVNINGLSTVADKDTEERIFLRLNKTIHESEAINILNECIHKNIKFSDLKILQIISFKRWVKSARLIVDFLLDLENPHNKENLNSEINSLVNHNKNYLQSLKNTFSKKKKNIIRISPIFEWSQDNDVIKIRLKFSKNLESPGEKDIQNFKMNCTRTHLVVKGYKIKEDYLTYYYRNIQLYDFIKVQSCLGYKETDGSFIIKFFKNQPTLYWNFLDQISDDHHSTYTWFDVFTAYDNKAKYTSFREWAMENLYMSDIDDYVKDRTEEKTRRLNRIKNIANYLVTKDYENKNYCNSPVHEKYCILTDINDWNYWLF